MRFAGSIECWSPIVTIVSLLGSTLLLMKMKNFQYSTGQVSSDTQRYQYVTVSLILHCTVCTPHFFFPIQSGSDLHDLIICLQRLPDLLGDNQGDAHLDQVVIDEMSYSWYQTINMA